MQKEEITMTSSKSEEIKNRLLEFSGLMVFKFGEMECDIDPFNQHLFHVACNGTEKDIYSIEDVMEKPLFAGYSLNEIAEEIEILDW